MRMRFFSMILVGFFLTVPVWSQGNVNEAKKLADTLSQTRDLPTNVRLRFQLLRDMMGGLAGKSDPSPTLSFFSTTRILFWNRPASSNVGQTMRDYEAQVVALASSRGVALDLPPVGYSTSGAAGGAVATPSRQLFQERATKEGLFEVTLRAEEAGTAALGSANSQELLALRDSFTVLRLDLDDSMVATEAVRNVLLARAQYLSSPAAVNAPSSLLQRLDTAAEVLRAQFPPTLLRQARGQSVNI